MSNGIHLRMLSPRLEPLDETFNHILKHGSVQLVNDLLSIALGQDQPRVLEYAQVAGDGWPAGAELVSDLARRAWPGAKQLEDLTAGWIGKRAENVVHI